MCSTGVALAKIKGFQKTLKALILLVAGGGFEPPTFRLWAWRATGLLHPAIISIANTTDTYAFLYRLSSPYSEKKRNYYCKQQNRHHNPIFNAHFLLRFHLLPQLFHTLFPPRDTMILRLFFLNNILPFPLVSTHLKNIFPFSAIYAKF